MVGYLRPVKQWNNGKRTEFEMRKTFDVERAVEEELEQPSMEMPVEVETEPKKRKIA